MPVLDLRGFALRAALYHCVDMQRESSPACLLATGGTAPLCWEPPHRSLGAGHVAAERRSWPQFIVPRGIPHRFRRGPTSHRVSAGKIVVMIVVMVVMRF